MLVFWKQKLVILAVPKTGTTALAAALGPEADIVINDPPELKHAPLFRYNRFFRPMFEKACKEDGMETMAIMREPVDWLSSWFRYRQRDFLVGKRTSTRGVSFDDFVLEYCKEDRAAFANVGSQAKFLEPRPNGTKINHLFRYEDQPSILSFLEERLEREIVLEQRNVSPNFQVTLSDQVRQSYQQACAAEFELYNSIR